MNNLFFYCRQFFFHFFGKWYHWQITRLFFRSKYCTLTRSLFRQCMSMDWNQNFHDLKIWTRNRLIETRTIHWYSIQRGYFLKIKSKKLIVINGAILFRIFISIALYHTFYIYTHILMSRLPISWCCYHISRSIFVNAIYCNGQFLEFSCLNHMFFSFPSLSYEFCW